MNKVLIIDGNTQVPVQLQSKFHKIIVIPNTEDILKVNDVNASNQDAITNFTKDLTNWVNKFYGTELANLDFKKLSISREKLISMITSFKEYREYFVNKYNITLEDLDSMVNQLIEFSTVKAKYEREFKSNPIFEPIRIELDSITKSSVQLKKSNINTILDPAKDLLELTKIAGFHGQKTEWDDVAQIAIKCDQIIKVVNRRNSILEKYSNLETINLSELRGDVKNPKLFEGLAKKVTLVRTLKVVPEISNLQANDYLAVGEGVAKVLAKFNNLGLRNTKLFYQLLALKVNKLGTGANICYIRTLSGAKANIDKLTYFFSDDFAKSLIPEKPTNLRVITNSKDAIETLKKLISIPEGHQFGFDYETNGKEIYSKEFEAIGYSIANTTSAIYIDLRYIKLLESIEALKEVLKYTKLFLDKHAVATSKSKVWVFNNGFELRVSYKLFGVFYEFWDYVVYRNIIGHHMEWWSLKYTAQFDLRIRSWDDNYDGIMDIIFKWLYKWNPSLGKKGDWELRNDREYFIKCLNECSHSEISKYKDEFIWLYDNGYNTQFTCIPAALIGGYGALDSYNTVYGARINQGKYDDRCERTFMDNIRLGSRLTGIYRNEELYQEYFKISYKMFNYATFHLARFSIHNQVNYFISQSQNWNSLDEVKSWLRSQCENDYTYWTLSHSIEYKSRGKHGRSILNYFRNDLYEGNVNPNLLNETLGTELGSKIYECVLKYSDWANNVYEEEVDTETEIDEDSGETISVPVTTVIDGEIVKKLSEELGLITFPLLKYTKSDKLDEALRIIRTNSVFEELSSCSIMNYNYFDFMKLDSYNLKMKEIGYKEFYPTILGYYKISSPGVYKDTFTKAGIVYEKEYKVMASFDRFDPCGNYRKDLCEKYLPFKSWDDMVNKVDEIWNTDPRVRSNNIAESLQPKKENEFTQAKRYYYINDDEFNGEYNEVCINDMYEKIININKQPLVKDGNSILMVALGAISKRYLKMITNYFAGVYAGPNVHQCKADKNLVSTEEGNDFRIYPGFRVNMVTTKRWSSGIHTIYGKSPSKRVFAAPPGYLVSYFDISSAEVRSAAYMSQDPDLINLFETGQDPYIWLAKLKYGQDASKSLLKSVRKKFKTTLLAQLYGQGVEGLAGRLKITAEESQELIHLLRSSFPVLFKWIERKQNYCVINRKIETFLGDNLEIFEFDTGRLKRAGINYCVQGYIITSLISNN